MDLYLMDMTHTIYLHWRRVVILFLNESYALLTTTLHARSRSRSNILPLEQLILDIMYYFDRVQGQYLKTSTSYATKGRS